VGTFAEVTSDSGDNNTWGPWYATESSSSQFPSILQQPTPGHRQPKNRRKLLLAVIAGGVAIVAAIAAIIVFVVSPGGSSQTTGFLPSSNSSESDAQQTASAFLQAWQSGDLQQAANYTDSPAEAKAALATYQTYLHLKKLSASVSTSASSSGNSVAYSATAKVATSDAANAITGNWSYQASLDTYQEKNGSYWYVKWAPDDLAPNLTSTTRLAAVQVAPQVASVTDSGGNNLTSYNDPGLANIVQALQNNAPTGGTPGLYVEIQTNQGKAVPNSQAVVIAPGNVGQLQTTIDARAESAALSAVSAKQGSSMVVIQPSTGKILAIANNNISADKYDDFALTARVAPGSTGKIVSSTALFSQGVLNADSSDACPPTYTVDGIVFHNDAGETEPAGTPLYTDFAASCNNAFDRWYKYEEGGGLASIAKKYYGLNQAWDIGLGEKATYYNTPASATNAELAQEMFGEGEIQASPMGMASIAATVYTGSFEQPYLVAGTKRVTATPLPSSVDAGLKQMMRAVVTSGTATSISFGPNVYAKTGTADIVGQGQPNSWFVAFDTSKDVAIACLVLDSGYGAQFAAPEVKTFLDKY
jgi:hypothetical protein